MGAGGEYDIDVRSTISALGDTMAPGVEPTEPAGGATEVAVGETEVAVGETAAAPGGDTASTPGAGTVGAGDQSRYQLRGRLGEGGMGQVDWVWDSDLMRDLAVKRLRDALSGDAKLVQQFLWEARVTASLDHPNVVPVHDLGVTPKGELYFTMKRVGGTSMSGVISQLAAEDPAAVEQYTLPRRLRLFMQLCQAVSFAHARGVLHRDLKPDNVMLGEHGEVQVMDWGIALAIGDGAESPICSAGGGPTVTDRELSGTPMYMAPEQAACEELDECADVFSLGAILYELCSLHMPYRAKNVKELLGRVRDGKVRPLIEVAPDLSPSLVAVIERAMDKDREHRYQSVAELLADVERVVDGRTPDAETASLAKRVARYALREDRRLGTLRPIQIDLVFAGALVAGAGVGALVAEWLRPWAAVAIAIGAALCIPFGLAWLRTLKQDPRGE